jgi:iron complex outermembrane receptor protein
MAYVAHRHGYRSGGFTQRLEEWDTGFPFKPSKLNDIELGIKADWRFGDMLLRTNLAWYYSWWRDIQVEGTLIAPSGALASVILNAAEAELQGFELELTFSPFEGLEISAHGAHQDGEFTDFETFDPLLGAISRSGIDFANAKWRAGGTVRYTLPLSSEIGDVTLTANYFAKSTAPGNPLTPKAIRSVGEISKYNLVNLRIDWTDVMGWPVDAALFLTNATDQIYVASQLNLISSFGYNIQSYNEPRFWGVSLTYRFGG